MKPTDKQIEIINTIMLIVEEWKGVDLDSYAATDGVFKVLDANLDGIIDTSECVSLENWLGGLFNAVRTMK